MSGARQRLMVEAKSDAESQSEKDTRWWFEVHGATVKAKSAVPVFWDQTATASYYRERMHAPFKATKRELELTVPAELFENLEMWFLDFDTMGGQHAPSGTISFKELVSAFGRIQNASTAESHHEQDAHSKGMVPMMAEIASISRREAIDFDIGFDYRDFCLAYCKFTKQVLPPATAATVNQRVWEDTGSMSHTMAFMELVQQYKVLDMSFSGWFYDSNDFKREEQSYHDFSLLGNAPDVADSVFLESLMNHLEPFDAYGRISTIFISVTIFTVAWWPAPFVALIIMCIEFRLDMWRLTNLQVTACPSPAAAAAG
jgi:hypothetical protein